MEMVGNSGKISAWKVFFQTFGNHIAITLFVICAFVVYAWCLGNKLLHDTDMTDLRAHMQSIMDLEFKDSLSVEEFSLISVDVANKLDNSSIRFTSILSSGAVVSDSNKKESMMENHSDRSEIQKAFEEGDAFCERYSSTLGRKMLYYAKRIPVSLENGSSGFAVVRVSIPSTELKSNVGVEWKPLLIFLLAVLGFVVLLSFLTSLKIIRPVKSIIDGVVSFSKGDYSSRITVPDTPHLAELVHNVNALADTLVRQIYEANYSRDYLSTILENIPLGIFVISNKYKVISSNKVAATYFDKSKESFIDSDVEHETLRKFVEEINHNGKSSSIDITLGKSIYEVRMLPLTDALGWKSGVLVVMRDITELRHLEMVRKDFVANVAHELRTPITSLVGFSEMLEKTLQDEKSKQFNSIIKRQAVHMNAIVDDLLTISCLESNDVAKRDFSQVNVKSIIDSAIEECSVLAEERNVDIRVSCDDDLDIVANDGLIEQALVNLITNAIKYGTTEKSRFVEIDVAKKDSTIDIAVQDYGNGIPEEFQSRVFERFYRIDKGRSREMGGTGLGLAIVKHIVRVHNGEVLLKSEPGKGSRFTIRLMVNH